MTTNETSIRVRIVRCPKCSQRLVELPDFTLYKCGGCGTVLQAKNWKPETYPNESQRNDSNEIEARSLESSPDKENERFEHEHDDCSVVELCLDSSVSNSHSSSPEIKFHFPIDNELEDTGDDARSENSDYKLDDDKDTCDDVRSGHDEGTELSSLTSHDRDLDGGIGGVNHDIVSARRNIEHVVDDDDDDDWVRIGSPSPQRATNESPDDSRIASQSSPTHVSLYISSPDEVNLDQPPIESSFRQFSSSDTLGNSPMIHGSDRSVRVRDFSEFSYNGNEDQSFELPFTWIGPDVVRRSRSPSSFVVNSLPPRPSSLPSHEPLGYDTDEIDLLRTVSELKAQLKSMQLVFNNSVPPPFHYSARQGDLHRDQNHSSSCHLRAHNRCSCLHCCPQKHHYSAQLPLHFMHHCKNSHCRSSGHNSLQGYEPTLDHHKNRGNDMKKLLVKEKHRNSAKKHLLPLAGGVPFVTCFYCSELLQLPTDFMIFNRRYHRLTCSSCEKVLKFSLIKGSKIVPCHPNASAPLSSNVKRESRSIDHGPSFVRSCSADYSGAVEHRKMKPVLRDSQNKSKGTKEPVKYRKTTSEIEERRKLSNSPLHRLMGYSCPTQVLNN